jgi:hypothetical protein
MYLYVFYLYIVICVYKYQVVCIGSTSDDVFSVSGARWHKRQRHGTGAGPGEADETATSPLRILIPKTFCTLHAVGHTKNQTRLIDACSRVALQHVGVRAIARHNLTLVKGWSLLSKAKRGNLQNSMLDHGPRRARENDRERFKL